MNPRRPPAADAAPWRILRSAWFWRASLGALIVVILYLALKPVTPSDMSTGWDKLNHALAFCALALTACFSAPPSPRRLLLAAALLLGFGGAIELMQLRIPGRDAEWADLLANTVGVVAGMLLATMSLRSKLLTASRRR